MAKKLRLLFVIDEASTVFRRSMEIREGSDVLSDNFVMDRERGIGYIIISQRLEDLSRNVIGNCSRKIVIGGLGTGYDYQIFGSSVGLLFDKIEFLKRRTQPGQACVSDYRYPEAFTLDVPYFPYDNDVPSQSIKDRIKEFDILGYLSEPVAGDQATNEGDSFAADRAASKSQKKNKVGSDIMLVFNYLSNPYTYAFPQSQMFTNLGLSSGSKKNKIKKKLLANKWIEEHWLPRGRGKVCFWEITEKARKVFDLSELRVPGRGGFLHRVVGWHCHRWAVDNGYSCKLETHIGTNNKAVDALLIKDKEIIVMEFCMSEPVEKELSNIVKDFESGFDITKLKILAKDSKMKKKLEQAIAGDLQASLHKGKIEIMLAGEFIKIK